MDASVGGEDGRAGLGRHWLDVNVIAVVVVYDQHVGVASRGSFDKSAGEIAENLAGR